MELFKRPPEALVESNLPQVFVTVVSAEGSVLPSVTWATLEQYTSFAELVSVREGVVIVAVRDIDAELDAVALVSENAAICGVQIVHVSGVTDYVYSARADQSFWGCPSVVFEEWSNQADEAARETELAKRAAADHDEMRLIRNARADGTFKKTEVTEVKMEEEAEEEPPVF